MSNLKPCPFCGGRAVPRPWLGERSGVVGAEPHFVRCENCKTATKLFDMREDAAAAWNSRFGEVQISPHRIAP